MARKEPFRAIVDIDPAALASFQAEIRKRYSALDVAADAGFLEEFASGEG